MGVHILGLSKVVNFGSCKYWPERGLIHCEDTRDNSYHTITCYEMLVRLKALNEMKPQYDGGDGAKEKAVVKVERKRLQEFIDGMIEVVKAAQAQGEPFDPTAVRAARRALPKQVLIDKLPTKLTGQGIVRS